MGRYNFISPGAAAGDSIVDVLTARRAEERQRLLDEIASKNAEVNRRATESNIKLQGERGEREQLDFADDTWQQGDDLSNIDPVILEIARRTGRLGPAPQGPVPSTSAKVSGEAEPMDDAGELLGPPQTMALPRDPNVEVVEPPAMPTPPSHQNYYRGSADDQKRTRVNKNTQAFLDQLKANPDMSEIERILGANTVQENEGVLPAGFWNALQEREQFHSYDPETNKLTPQVDAEGKPVRAPRGRDPIIMRSREPRELRDTGQYLGPVMGPDGQPVPGKIMMIQNGRPAIVDLPGGAASIGAKPTAASQSKKDQVPVPLMNAFTNSLGRGPGGVRQPVEKQLQAAQAIISNYPTHPDVRETISDILRASEPGVTFEQLRDAYKSDFPADQYTEFLDLLSLVAPMLP